MDAPTLSLIKKNPNSKPIGERFGFLLFGAGDRT